MTLTFDQYLAIAGLVVGVVGVVVGVVGVGVGIRSDKKMKAAQEAEKQIERKFMHYMAAQEFEKLALEAVSIIGKIREREWQTVAELADGIAPTLGQVRGARNRLLLPLEKDKLDAAATNIQQFIDSLPLADQEAELPEERVQTMLSRCRPLVDVASEMAGRLRVESIQHAKEDK